MQRPLRTVSCALPPRFATPVALVVGDLLGKLVPPHPLSDLGPETPPERLRGLFGPLAKDPGLLHWVEGGVWRNEPPQVLRAQRREPIQVAGDRPPPPPVLAHDGAQPCRADRPRIVRPAHRERRQEVDGVLEV